MIHKNKPEGKNMEDVSCLVNAVEKRQTLHRLDGNGKLKPIKKRDFGLERGDFI